MIRSAFTDVCVACGISVWLHRVDGRQLSCADLLQRRRELGLAESDDASGDPHAMNQAVEAVRGRIATVLNRHLAVSE